MLRSRPLILVVFALAIVLVALVVVGESRAGPPDAVYSEATLYISYLSPSGQGRVTIERIVRASQPWNFVRETSKATFADSVYYETTYGLASPAQAQAYGASRGGRAVPFPPLNLWCVQLSNGSIIFVGEHHDMYNADYILHEAADAEAAAANVGCNLR